LALTARIIGGKPAAATTRTLRRGRERSNTPPPRDDSALTAALRYDNTLHHEPLYVEPLKGSALSATKSNAQDIRRLIQPWQAQSMSYYDLVPEVKFATNFFAQMIGGVRLFPAIVDPKTHEPEELDAGPIFDLFEKIIGPTGGRSGLQESYAKLRFLIGESYLTVSPSEEYGEVWECLSPNELRVQPGGIASRFRAPMLSADQYSIGVSEYLVGNDPATIAKYGPLGPEFTQDGPDVIVVYRLWRPSPAYTWLADCNMKAAVDSGILEELVLSTYSVRAQLKSRMNQNGVWFVPDEISFASLGGDPEEDSNSDIFQQRLNEVMMASLRDPGSAEAMLPIIARVSAEFCDKANLVKFNDVQGDLAEINQRSEMIGRFATCIELPKEVVTGTADINHWGAWLIDEQTYDSYGRPGSLEMASDFCAAYLQPAAREAGIKNWEDVRIGVDPSEVIHHPDRAKDALTLRQQGLISDKVFREALGYNDNDAMSDLEYQHWAGIQLKDASYFAYAIPSVRANIEPAEGDIESATGEVQGADVTPATGEDIKKGPPQNSPAAQDAPALQASAAMQLEQRILGAADLTIQRGRELAGARLRARLTPNRGRGAEARCEECLNAISERPNWDVAWSLGAEQVRFLKIDAGLVEGTAELFATTVERMGVPRAWATRLGELVEQHAARTVFDENPAPMPAAFVKLLGRINVPIEV